MSELDASTTGTSRLRRRSFFENSDGESGGTATPTGSGLDAIALNDMNATSSGDRDSADAASAGADAAPNALDATALGRHRRASYGAGAPRTGWLARLWRVHAWLRVKWQTLKIQRARLAGRRASTTETLVVKQWAYATHWLKYAIASLLVLQLVLFWQFQIDRLDLRVEECIFQDKMLPLTPVRELLMAGGAATDERQGAQPQAQQGAAAARRFLERRFEQQFAPIRHNSKQPGTSWACIALVPADPQRAQDAQALSWLLPRSQIVQGDAIESSSSRLQLVVGAGATKVARGTSESILAVLLPPSELRASAFAQGFPDLVMVSTEHALKQLLQYRQTQQDAADHRRLAATPTAIDKPQGEDDAAQPTAKAAAAADHERARSQFAIFLLKASVPDIYDRRLHKAWESFLHVVVANDDAPQQQYTKELLALWRKHPEWPMLHVRFPHAPGLCTKLEPLGKHDDGAGDRYANIDLSCDGSDNAADSILLLKNQIGVHIFPVSPDNEADEHQVLETLAVGAIAITYNTPVMHEFVPDASGLRVGTFEPITRTDDAQDAATAASLVETYRAQVTSRDIERAISSVMALDRVHRVAAGRAARAHYLTLRAHYLTAVAALDAALCEVDRDDAADPSPELGQRSRKRVDIDVLRTFLY